jgi:iron donor protein CyaY
MRPPTAKATVAAGKRNGGAMVYNRSSHSKKEATAMSERLSEKEFQEKADRAIRALEDAFATLGEQRDLDVEVEGGVLSVTFEEGEPGRFIVSPNSAVRQLWVSARVASFKFDWSEAADDFVLAGTGEPIKQVMERLAQEQLGDPGATL